MQRLTLDQPIPEHAARRASSRSAISTASTSATRRWSAGRSQRGFHERRPVIVATFDPHPVRHLQARRAAVPADQLDQRERLFAHAGADAMLVFRVRRRARRDHRRGFRRPSCWPGRSARRGSSPATTSPSARAAAASRRAAELGAKHRRRRRGGRAGAARRRARSRRAGSARRCAAGDPAHRDAPAEPPVRDRGRGRARRPARPRARLSDRQHASSATISGPPTASTRCA